VSALQPAICVHYTAVYPEFGYIHSHGDGFAVALVQWVGSGLRLSPVEFTRADPFSKGPGGRKPPVESRNKSPV